MSLAPCQERLEFPCQVVKLVLSVLYRPGQHVRYKDEEMACIGQPERIPVARPKLVSPCILSQCVARRWTTSGSHDAQTERAHEHGPVGAHLAPLVLRGELREVVYTTHLFEAGHLGNGLLKAPSTQHLLFVGHYFNKLGSRRQLLARPLCQKRARTTAPTGGHSQLRPRAENG